jgi:putative lipoprotein
LVIDSFPAFTAVGATTKTREAAMARRGLSAVALLTTRMVSVLVLVACASTPRAGPSRLTGTVLYRERITLPLDAVVSVQLQDVSRRDAPAVLLAEQVIQTAGRQVPFAFELTYDPAAILPNHTYVVRAAIRSGDRLLFTTTQQHRVLSAGQPSSVEVVVERVGS